MSPTTSQAQKSRRSPATRAPASAVPRLWPRRTLLWAGAAVLLGLLVYLPTLRYGFVYDDVPQILQNPEVQAHNFQTEFFTGHVWQHLFPQWKGNYYRPLFMLWIQGSYLLFGAGAWWWHGECLAIHGLATMLLFVLARRLLGDDRQAFLAAALFAVLPVHAEVVAWISAGDQSLACVFVLVSLLCWLRGRERGRYAAAWVVAAVAAFLAAAFMQEEAIVLPAVVFLYEWTLGDGPRAGLRRSLPFGLVAAVYLAARLSVLGGMANSEDTLSAGSVLLTLPSVVWFYCVRLVLPFGTSLFYELHAVTAPSFYGFVIPLVQCVAVGGMAVVVARSSRRAAFLLGAGLAFLLPALAGVFIFSDYELVHDRYLYLPSAFLMVLAVMGLRQLAARWPRTLRMVTAGAFLMLLGAGTLAASYPWHDTLVLFRSASAAAPHNPRVRLFLADELVKRGDPAAAIPLYNEVLASHSLTENAMLGMGAAHFNLGQYAEAERLFKKAELEFSAHPSSTIYYYLGMSDNRMERFEQAESYLRKAIAMHPEFSRYHYELAVALKGEGKLEEARQALRTELAIYPQSPGARELLRQIGG